MEVFAVTDDFDHSVGGLLSDLNGLKPFRNLWIYVDLSITRLSRDDASERLIEPAADSVEAVVQTTAVRVPMLPSPGSSVVDHIKITGIRPFFEHPVHEITLPCQGCPFGDDRYTHETGLQMSVIHLCGTFQHLVPHLFPQIVRDYAHKQRISHVNL